MNNIGYDRLAAAALLTMLGISPAAASNKACSAETREDLRKAVSAQIKTHTDKMKAKSAA